MLVKTRGIVFRSIKYAESSMICDVYTEELGLRSYLVSGVRTRKPKVAASALQVMTLLDLVAYQKANRSLNRVKEIKPAVVFEQIPFDIRKSSIGLFMIELARKTIKEAESNPPLFRFLINSFIFLDHLEYGVANFHLYFTVHLSRFLGFLPGGQIAESDPFFDLREGVFVPGHPGHLHHLDGDLCQLLDRILKMPVSEIGNLKLNRQTRQAFLDKMLIYYRHHVENMTELQTHQVLKEVLGS